MFENKKFVLNRLSALL